VIIVNSFVLGITIKDFGHKFSPHDFVFSTVVSLDICIVIKPIYIIGEDNNSGQGKG
jgi:hypothetical protein